MRPRADALRGSGGFNFFRGGFLFMQKQALQLTLTGGTHYGTAGLPVYGFEGAGRGCHFGVDGLRLAGRLVGAARDLGAQVAIKLAIPFFKSLIFNALFFATSDSKSVERPGNKGGIGGEGACAAGRRSFPINGYAHTIFF